MRSRRGKGAAYVVPAPPTVTAATPRNSGLFAAGPDAVQQASMGCCRRTRVVVITSWIRVWGKERIINGCSELLVDRRGLSGAHCTAERTCRWTAKLGLLSLQCRLSTQPWGFSHRLGFARANNVLSVPAFTFCRRGIWTSPPLKSSNSQTAAGCGSGAGDASSFTAAAGGSGTGAQGLMGADSLRHSTYTASESTIAASATDANSALRGVATVDTVQPLERELTTTLGGLPMLQPLRTMASEIAARERRRGLLSATSPAPDCPNLPRSRGGIDTGSDRAAGGGDWDENAANPRTACPVYTESRRLFPHVPLILGSRRHHSRHDGAEAKRKIAAIGGAGSPRGAESAAVMHQVSQAPVSRTMPHRHVQMWSVRHADKEASEGATATSFTGGRAAESLDPQGPRPHVSSNEAEAVRGNSLSSTPPKLKGAVHQLRDLSEAARVVHLATTSDPEHIPEMFVTTPKRRRVKTLAAPAAKKVDRRSYTEKLDDKLALGTPRLAVVGNETTLGAPRPASSGVLSPVAADDVVEGADGVRSAAPEPGAASRTSDDPQTNAVPVTSSTSPANPDSHVPEGSQGASANASLEVLPKSVAEKRIKRNAMLKRQLMQVLGNEFMKAGMQNDGVRTSFSIISSHAVKQATGLTRVPSKLLVSCLRFTDNAWDWVDISAHPTASLDEYRDSLSRILTDLGTHDTLVNDAMEPMLMPQATVLRGCHCLLIRYAFEEISAQMDSFQELTNRFTIFVTDKRIVTVHRTHCAFIEELKKNWTVVCDKQANRSMAYFLHYFVKQSVGTFSLALTKSIVEFDKYEASLFTPQKGRSSLAREIYHIKRRASVYARTLNLIGDSYTHVCSTLRVHPTDVNFQDVQQDVAHVKGLSEELNANADSVLQLLFQLSSYQLNELMRVLTMFSAFFIPLSFIASVFGMNFTDLPLVSSSDGHWYCLILMCLVGASLGGWFKAKRFF